MHPDKKVGMALGILLVGIVGAFFFRNDTEATEQDDSRKLASAEELDELTIETEVLEFKRVTTTWRQRILRGDELICSQDLRAALIDERGRPVRFDDAMLDALSVYAAAPSDPKPT